MHNQHFVNAHSDHFTFTVRLLEYSAQLGYVTLLIDFNIQCLADTSSISRRPSAGLSMFKCSEEKYIAFKFPGTVLQQNLYKHFLECVMVAYRQCILFMQPVTTR